MLINATYVAVARSVIILQIISSEPRKAWSYLYPLVQWFFLYLYVYYILLIKITTNHMAY